MKFFSLIILATCSLTACGGESAAARQDFGRAMQSFALQDTKGGMALLEKAAAGGSSDAALELGYRYLRGTDVQKNETGALALFRQAARAGNVDAAYNTGLAYVRGQGTNIDLAEAAEWFTAAAKLGDAGAAFNLGLMFMNGEGVKQDAAIAYAWFRVADAAGFEGADEAMRKARKDLTADQKKTLLSTVEKITSGVQPRSH